MAELIELGIAESAAAIVERYGAAAPARVAAEAVELLRSGDRHGYATLMRTLPRVEALLAEA